MNLLIIKLGATGDVVRTTPLLEKFNGEVTWITAAKNLPLLKNLRPRLHALAWEQREAAAAKPYDLVINLEDTQESCEFARTLKFEKLFGAFLDPKLDLLRADLQLPVGWRRGRGRLGRL